MGLLSRLSRRREPVPVVHDPDDPRLVVLVRAGDPAVADSAVLAAAAQRGLDVARPLLVRHRVVGLTGDRAGFTGQLEQSYAVRWTPEGTALVSRTEVPSARGLAGERSRMAGLAQRFGGDVDGYELLAPQEPGPGAATPSVGSGA